MKWLVAWVMLCLIGAIIDMGVEGSTTSTAYNHITTIATQAQTLQHTSVLTTIWSGITITGSFLASMIWLLLTWDFSFLNVGAGIYFKWLLIVIGIIVFIYNVVLPLKGTSTS